MPLSPDRSFAPRLASPEPARSRALSLAPKTSSQQSVGPRRRSPFTAAPERGHKAAMQVHRGYWSLPKAALHGVVAIGNFDGVHRGHRALIDAARTRARELQAPLGVVTFEP